MESNDRDWIRFDEHLPKSAREAANGRAAKDDGTAESEFDGVTAMGVIGQGKALLRLHVIREPGKRISFQYQGLDSHSEYEPGRFVVDFAGTRHWRVTVTGRNLWRVYDGITRHAVPWIQQTMPGRDFEERKGQAVITGISVEEVGKKG